MCLPFSSTFAIIRNLGPPPLLQEVIISFACALKEFYTTSVVRSPNIVQSLKSNFKTFSILAIKQANKLSDSECFDFLWSSSEKIIRILSKNCFLHYQIMKFLFQYLAIFRHFQFGYDTQKTVMGVGQNLKISARDKTVICRCKYGGLKIQKNSKIWLKNF